MKVRTRKENVGDELDFSREREDQLVTKSLAEARRAEASEPGVFSQASLRKTRVRRIPARAKNQATKSAGRMPWH